MPNHCLNKLETEGDSAKIQEFFAFIKGDKPDEDGEICEFDFNKIIPMPESLQITSGSITDYGMVLLDPSCDEVKKYLGYRWKNSKDEAITTYEMLVAHLRESAAKSIDEALRMGRMALDNLKQYGHKDWYTWAVENWGTKWGAYDIEIINEPDIENYEIVFSTAWSYPKPIIEKLGELFPDLSFTLHYFEPGCGFAGCLEVEGEESNDNYSEDSDTVQSVGETEFGMEPWDEDEDEDEDEDSEDEE